MFGMIICLLSFLALSGLAADEWYFILVDVVHVWLFLWLWLPVGIRRRAMARSTEPVFRRCTWSWYWVRVRAQPGPQHCPPLACRWRRGQSRGGCRIQWERKCGILEWGCAGCRQRRRAGQRADSGTSTENPEVQLVSWLWWFVGDVSWSGGRVGENTAESAGVAGHFSIAAEPYRIEGSASSLRERLSQRHRRRMKKIAHSRRHGARCKTHCHVTFETGKGKVGG